MAAKYFKTKNLINRSNVHIHSLVKYQIIPRNQHLKTGQCQLIGMH